MATSTERYGRAENLKVLVVDDDAPVRMIAALMLERVGFKTIQASSASEALSISSRERVDVVLTDVQMPGMNGVELAHQLGGQFPNLPIVIMSGFAPDGLVERSGLPFIPKPFAADSLIGAVRTAAASARNNRMEWQVA